MSRLLIFIILLTVLSACSWDKSNKQPIQPSNSPKVEHKVFHSYPYALVVWNGQPYKITDEEVLEVDEFIGTVEKEMKEGESKRSNNSSNYYGVGTEMWSIRSVDTEQAIAIKHSEDKFIKVVVADYK